MSYATSELRRAAIVLCLTAAAALASTHAAAVPITPSDNATFAPMPDNATVTATEAQKKLKEKKALARKVAWASLCIILLLIIFTVFVMIYSRRTRTRYLKQYQRIRYSKIWDVWWQKSGKGEGKNKG